jgi:outer membrane protein OmpA-like peptidoglycan-associated protein
MTRVSIASLLVLSVGLAASSASAQSGSLQLNHYRMAETGEDGFAISRPDDRGHLRLGVRLDLDYNLNALVYESSLGMTDTEELSVVEHNLDLAANVSLGLFDRVVLWVGLMPTNFLMSGGDINAIDRNYANADGAGIGDLRAGGRVRIFGERTDLFALGFQLDVTLPLSTWANALQRYTGERGATLHPELLGELRFGGGWRLTLNVGARFRLTDQGRLGPEPTMGMADNRLNVSHELTWGAGLTIPFWTDEAAGMGLTGHVEVWGDNTFEGFADRESSPIEALLGLRFEVARGWYAGLAGGTGISRGYGAPDFRGVLSLAFADRAAPGPVDTDGDGINDDVDECPTEPEDLDVWQDEDGCPEPDNDADGILDGDDACPIDPEDVDGDEDTDGCPDVDTDGDGINDNHDECVTEPEDRDTYQDEDGCPDPDNDSDLVLDVNDGAPMDPEDRDGFADADGIPDPDNDGDTVLDPNDECPLAPGPVEHNGCPQAIRLDVETGTIYILQRVEFATNRDVILDRSFPVLEEVRATLAANPQLLRIRIEGHTDDRGRDAANLDLSMRRARSVMHWLVEHGIEAGRLTGYGCGETRPVEANSSAEGRQANRRVEFRVIDPVPASGEIASMEGCLEVTEAPPAAASGGRRRRRGAE